MTSGIDSSWAYSEAALLDEALTELYEGALEAGRSRALPGGGVPTGFARLDAVTGGIRKGELVTVAGGAGAGKTSFALNVAVGASAHAKVLIFSGQSSRADIARRIVCAQTMRELHWDERGRLSEEDDGLVQAVFYDLYDREVRVCDDPMLTPARLVETVRRHAERTRRLLVVVDGVDFAYADIGRAAGQVAGAPEVGATFKGLARELGASVLATAEVPMSPDEDDAWPGAQLKRAWSAVERLGELGAVSDAVLIVERSWQSLFDDLRPALEYAPVTIAKHRRAPCAMVDLAFMPEFGRFDEWPESPRA